MRSQTLFWGILLLANVACSGENSDGDDPGSGGGAGQASGGSAGSGASSGGSGTGGAGGTASGGKGGSTGSAGSAGSAGSSGFTEVGVCGQRGESIVTATTFDGFEEFYIIGEEGLGTEICIVRFDLTRVGEAPPGCVDLQAEPCLWTHRIAYSNPMVVLDEDGVCANSDLGLDDAAIAAIDGTEASYGYVFEYQGHNSVRLKYDPGLDMWGPNGNAGYNEATGEFTYNNLDGFCNFAAPPCV